MAGCIWDGCTEEAAAAPVRSLISLMYGGGAEACVPWFNPRRISGLVILTKCDYQFKLKLKVFS